MAPPDPVAKFIERWSKAAAAERANYQLFLSELSDILDVARPEPATDDTAHNSYVFERAVTFHHRGSEKTTTGRIDLYKRGCFVLEAKQYATAKAAENPELELALSHLDDSTPKSPKVARGTAAWDRAMLEAYSQAERYARSLPDDEDSPPFLLVVDVGHVIELYADFTQKGKNYLPFPDARSHRVKLADLANPDLRERLRLAWTTPLALDPAKKAAAVTREVAGYLAELAKSFERQHDPKDVAEFLSRCLFCMFAEDVGLLPKDAFKQFLDSIKDDPGAFVPLVEQLFEDMNQGRVSGLLRRKLLYFNGGLFASAKALPVNATQLGLLRAAAALEWRHVEPAIFGTLLERALSPDERHKLGAHYTPRAYVERLVLPTVIEPLREEWSAVRTAAVTLASRGTTDDMKKARASLAEARKEVSAFHQRLCAIKVLDPACGSGNFLYVALELMKRLEGEVVALLHDLSEDKTDFLALQGVTVDPHQFLGLELNPRAAAIAELVLWIGYLQWHFRIHGSTMPAEPVLRKFKNIENRDAVLAYDERGFARDAHGNIRFVWDRKTTKLDAVTGREVPDGEAVIPLETFSNPRPAEWPHADFIVGNPPFLGTKRMRDDLGDCYVETLRAVYADSVEDNADFVMYWWHKAAEHCLSDGCTRFGFITTNSIRQTFNRRVVHRALLHGISLRFAIPDHPWVDTADGAAVRVAMTVGAVGYKLPPPQSVAEDSTPDPSALAGDLYLVTSENPSDDGSSNIELSHLRGRIGSGLGIGAELEGMNALTALDGVCGLGVALHGSGFIVDADEAKALRKYGAKVIKPYLGGSDLVRESRERYLIDFSFMSQDEARGANPQAFERVLTHVRPERLVNRREAIKRLWWRFGWERPEIRKALHGLPRFIATTETSKHRVFQFLDASILPDHMVIIVASQDAFHHGVLSSCIHVVYSLAAGGRLGVGNDPRYNKTRCFDPFPFPDCTEKQKEKIRALAEELDAHRKRAQATHKLGLTDIYNVLGKIRAGTALNAKDKTIHDAALVSTLKQLHDDLDLAVADAYGWPWPLTDAEILERVVALNTARAAEEAQGQIRWLRPDYQKPLFSSDEQAALGLEDKAPDLKSDTGKNPKASSGKSKLKIPKSKLPWPKSLADRVRAVETALAAEEKPVTAAALAKRFLRANPEDLAEILDTLVTLARARPGDIKGTFVH
ncbi:MAG: DNA methyltransferase [Opitutaceae bacterium]